MDALPALCPSDETLVGYGLGRADGGTADLVARHLSSCPACRRRVAGRSAADPGGTIPPGKALTGLARAVPSLPPAEGVPPELLASGQYADIRELGRGGMGVVYLARNVLLDRDEVLKVLDKGLLARPGAAERFLREMRAAAKLNHPQVVTAYSALKLGDGLAFAMEYVDGTDLHQLVQTRGPVLVPNACFYVYHAALGLQHAHDKGMVHRDIKPSNLILTRADGKSVVKVLDFGLAKATSEKEFDPGLTGANSAMGTPDYMAPEQGLDAARADIRADVYGLGCTLYYLLTGRPPFAGKSMLDLLQKHQRETARPLNEVRPEVPAALAAVVARMMAKSPDDRYQTPGEVAKLLTPFVNAPAAKPVVNLPFGGGRPAPPAGDGPQPDLWKTIAPTPRVRPDRPAPAADAPRPPAPAAPPPGRQLPSVFRDGPVPQHTHHMNPEDFVPRDKPAKSDEAKPNESPKSARVPKPEPRAKPKPKARRKRSWALPTAAATAVLVGLVVAWAFGAFQRVAVKTPAGTLVVDVNVPDAELLIDGEKVTVTWAGGRAEVSLKPGTHQVQVRKDGYTFAGKDEVTVAEGVRHVFTAALVKAGPKDGPKDKPKDEFVPLFNGKDLAGWKTHPSQPGNWRVENGTLVGSGPAATGHLYTDRADYTDFQLRCEARINDGGNSGVYVRTGFGPDFPAANPRWLLGYNAKLHGPRLGGLLVEDGRKADLIRTHVPAAAAGRWVALEVIARGDRLVVKCDGEVTADHVDPQRLYTKGHIVLQQHGPATTVEFRKVEIQEVPPEPAAEFVPLFNGKDLTGWKTHPTQPGGWTVEGGAIVGKGPTPSHLYTTADDYEDVHVRAEAMINDGGNSGLYARTPFGPTFPVANPRFPDGYEAQIYPTGPEPLKTGTLYVASAGAVVKVAESPAPPNRWFVLELILADNLITVRVDGKEAARYVDDQRRYRKGHVALQMHDAKTEVRFRKVEVKRLGPAQAATPAAPLRRAGAAVAFAETTGATPAELRKWAAALPAGQRPVWVAARAGTDAVLFDAVAVPDPEVPAWRLSVNETHEEVGADHKKSGDQGGYAPELIVPFPAGDVKVWVKGRGSVSNWFGGRDFVAGKLTAVKGGRGWPLSVGVAGRGKGLHHTVSIDHDDRRLGPPDFEFLPDLGPDELAAKVEAYRRQGWRPRHLSAHPGRTELRYAALFAENVPAVEWDFAPGLTEAEYRAAVAERKAAGYRPQSVTSVGGGEVRYTVAWAGDPFQEVRKGALVPAAEGRRLAAAYNRDNAANGAAFQVEGDELVVTGGPHRAGTLHFGEPFWTDYDFSARVKFTDPVPGASLFVRDNHEYDGRRRPDGRPSTERAAGVFPFAFSGNLVVAVEGFRDRGAYIRDGLPRAEVPNLLKPGEWHTAVVKVRGDTVETYLNGQPIHRAKPPMPARGGVAVRAIETGAVRFKDLKVTAPDGKVLWDRLPEVPN